MDVDLANEIWNLCNFSQASSFSCSGPPTPSSDTLGMGWGGKLCRECQCKWKLR